MLIFPLAQNQPPFVPAADLGAYMLIADLSVARHVTAALAVTRDVTYNGAVSRNETLGLIVDLSDA